MRLGDIFNPWAALDEARSLAEQWRLRATSAYADVRRGRLEKTLLEQQVTRLRRERDEARETCLEAMPMLEELATLKRRRSAAISRGNRTRALRRRGGLLPAPINDIPDASASHLRTEHTG